MLRCDFLKFQGAFLCSSAAGLVLPGAAMASARGLPRRTQQLQPGTPSAATRAAVELLGGMSRFVKKVVIKPNMSFAADVEIATNTHSVGALLRMCLEAGAARVLVLDYAFRSGRDSSLVTSGILSACDGVREGLCHNLTHDLHYREITLEGQGACTPMPLCATFWTRMCS